MKHSTFFTLLFFAFAQCSFQQAREAKPTYNSFKARVSAHRSAMTGETLQQKQAYFYSLMNDSIPYYWTGTTWDFNGTTRNPRSGNIACGYFVTTTLQDLGFGIERIYLAQQAAAVVVQKLCTNIKTLNSVSSLKEHMQSQSNQEIYIVGLDFHVGFLIRDYDNYYFLHSNYIGRVGVMKEKIDESEALKASALFVVGSLSANSDFINGW